MEPVGVAVGVAASLITLGAAARSVFEASRDLYKSIDDAPNELRSVSIKAETVMLTLDQVLALRPGLDDDDVQLLPLDLRTTLALSLQMSYESLQKLKKMCSHTTERGNLLIRWRWAMLEKRPVEKILQQLGNEEQNLVVVLQLMNMYVLWLIHVNGLSTSTCTLYQLQDACLERSLVYWNS